MGVSGRYTRALPRSDLRSVKHKALSGHTVSEREGGWLWGGGERERERSLRREREERALLGIILRFTECRAERGHTHTHTHTTYTHTHTQG